MSTILVCRDKRKRYTRIFVPLLLGTFLLAMNAFGEGKEALQGTWAFIAYEAEGVSIPEEQITAAKLQVAFLGDKMIQKCDGNVLSEATYKVEDNRTPKTIDSFTTNGTEKGIYLVRLTDRRPSVVTPFERVEARIRHKLLLEKRKSTEKAFKAEVRQGVPIETFPDVVKAIPVPKSSQPTSGTAAPPPLPR